MPVVRTKTVGRPHKLVRSVGLGEFYAKRNRVLVFRGVGGLGDVLMHRMMFYDFKRLMPDMELHFACPSYYHDAVRDHPLVDAVLDSAEVDRYSYAVHYNTSTACGRAEMRLAPSSGPHRSDIWAAHCGVVLTRHDMQIVLTDEERAEGRRLIGEARDRDGPCVLVCPVSAMHQKNLSERQVTGIVEGLRDMGTFPLGLHSSRMWHFSRNGWPALGGLGLRSWMAVIGEADYVVSVDTSSFHCAGGMGRPVVGVFTFASGRAYGQHYPRAEVVQGPCPVGHAGCYDWTSCPSKAELKPCLTDVTAEMVLAKIHKMRTTHAAIDHAEDEGDGDPV